MTEFHDPSLQGSKNLLCSLKWNRETHHSPSETMPQCNVKSQSLFLLYSQGLGGLLPLRHLSDRIRSDQLLSRVRLFATPWIAARQASLSITNSRSSPRLTSIESVMPSSHLILCRPLLLLPPIPPGIRDFSNESTLCMRWPKYWSFSFSIIPSKEIPGLISFRMDWIYSGQFLYSWLGRAMCTN